MTARRRAVGGMMTMLRTVQDGSMQRRGSSALPASVNIGNNGITTLRRTIMDERTFSHCQSCGMPLKRSPNGGGTNLDGSISTMYCSRCYHSGSFTMPNMTLTQMQGIVTEKMQEMGFPRIFARLFSKRIAKLHRWKTRP